MEIEYYEDHRGRQSAYDYIMDLTSRSELDQVARHLRELALQGHRMRRPLAAFLVNGVYELRPGHHRILYGFNGRSIVLLHAFRKKTRDVPPEEIELALKRLKEWRQR